MRFEIFRRAFNDPVQPLLKKWGMVTGLFNLVLAAVGSVLLRTQSADPWAGVINILEIITGNGADTLDAAGWINLGGFSLLIPVLLSLFSIEAGSRLLAWGDEEGSLGLLLAYPIRRRRILLEKYTALPAGLLLLCLIQWVVLMVFSLIFGMHLQVGWTALACLNAGLLGLVFGTAAFMRGIYTGDRRQGFQFSVFLFLILYLVYRLPGLEPAVEFIKYLSPFTYTLFPSEPGRLITGIPWVSLGLVTILVAASWKGFDQRDLEIEDRPISAAALGAAQSPGTAQGWGQARPAGQMRRIQTRSGGVAVNKTPPVRTSRRKSKPAQFSKSMKQA